MVGEFEQRYAAIAKMISEEARRAKKSTNLISLVDDVVGPFLLIVGRNMDEGGDPNDMMNDLSATVAFMVGQFVKAITDINEGELAAEVTNGILNDAAQHLANVYAAFYAGANFKADLH